jgi:holin-like protein
MKLLIQFLIIIAFSFAGELLHYLLPLPIPASIYGIVLLFAALELKVIKVKHIRETSSFLIAVMPGRRFESCRPDFRKLRRIKSS